MRFISLSEVIHLHKRIIETSGGSTGIREPGALQSSIAQPLQNFDGQDLYPSVVEKAAALGYFLVCNHPFIDGNKRIGHAAMEVVLVLNGFEIDCPVDEQERVILSLASGELSRNEFATWVQSVVRPSSG